MRGVSGVERHDHPRPEAGKNLVVLPLVIESRRRARLTARAKEGSRAAGADEHRERLVARRLPRRIKRVVGQLVDDRVCKIERIALESRVEERIVEESKR